MAECMFTTESPSRLSVFFLSLILLGLGACSQGDSPKPVANTAGGPAGNGAAASTDAQASGFLDEGAPEEGDFLWDTPDLPAGIHLTIADVAVEKNITEAYLMSLWSEYSATMAVGTPTEELAKGFFVDPPQLFDNLVRGVILLREAEARFPNPDPAAVKAFQERMEGAAGSTKDLLIRRYGEEGWNAHVLRRYRLDLILEDFEHHCAQVTEEELYAYYDEKVLGELPPLDQRDGLDVSFEAMRDMLYHNLMRGRAVEAQEAWIDEVIVGVGVEADLPYGYSRSWTIEAAG